MSILKKFAIRLRELFSSSDTRDVVSRHERQTEKIRESLVQLIFQRKQTELQLKRVQAEALETKQDLEQAARSDRDDLAIHLMKELEEREAELQFLRDHLSNIVNDIELAKKTEAEMKQKLMTAKRRLAALSSRREILKARRTVQSQVQGSNQQDMGEVLQKKIDQLEAENESLHLQKPWQHERQQLRSSRQSEAYRRRLFDLKTRLNVSTNSSLKQLTYQPN